MFQNPDLAYLALAVLAAGVALGLSILGRLIPRRGDWLGIGAALAGFGIARALMVPSIGGGPAGSAQAHGVLPAGFALDSGLAGLLAGAFLAAAAGEFAACALLRGRTAYGRFFAFLWIALCAALVAGPAASPRALAIAGGPFVAAVALFGCARPGARPDGTAFARLAVFLAVGWAGLAAVALGAPASGPLPGAVALAFGALLACQLPLWGWVPRLAACSGPSGAVALAALLGPIGIAASARFLPGLLADPLRPWAPGAAAGVAGCILAGLASARARDLRRILMWRFLSDMGLAFALLASARVDAAVAVAAASASGHVVALAAACGVAHRAGTGETCAMPGRGSADRPLRFALIAGALAPWAPAGASFGARAAALGGAGAWGLGGADPFLSLGIGLACGLCALGAGRAVAAGTAGAAGPRGPVPWGPIGAGAIALAAPYLLPGPEAAPAASGALGVLLSGGLVLGALGERRPGRWRLLTPSGRVGASIAIEGPWDRGAGPTAMGIARAAAALDRWLAAGALRTVEATAGRTARRAARLEGLAVRLGRQAVRVWIAHRPERRWPALAAAAALLALAAWLLVRALRGGG